MAAELGEGEPDQKLDIVFQQDEADEILCSTAEKNVAGCDGISGFRMMDRSLMTKSVEYKKCLEEMREQLQIYQAQMSEMRQNFEQVTMENKRLHAELKEALEMQLDALPFVPLGTAIPADEEILRNLQEQLQLTSQGKKQAVELCQTALQELDQLQQQYQEHVTQTQINMAERLEQQSSQFLKTVEEQNVELEQLQKQLSCLDDC